MIRHSPASPGTTGFMATLVLTFAFAVIASALWAPREHNVTTLATEDVAASPALVVPVAAH